VTFIEFGLVSLIEGFMGLKTLFIIFIFKKRGTWMLQRIFRFQDGSSAPFDLNDIYELQVTKTGAHCKCN
jgi:hypothetical protein